MIKTSKTPFEIRTELLQLAHRIVYDRKVMQGNGGALLGGPTTEEVIEEATKLNAFVSQTPTPESE